MYLYCRLCADPRNIEELLNLATDEKKLEDVLSKLNAMYIDVSTHDKLPKTVCFPCYDSLNKAYEFLDKVKKAQDILSTLFSSNDSTKFGLSDDEGAALNEFFNEASDHFEVKSEIISPVKATQPVASDVVVKIEPKEEITDTSSILQDVVQLCQSSPKEGVSFQELLKPVRKKVYKVKTDVKTIAVVSEKTLSWRKYPWACRECSIEFTDLDILRTHNKTIHKKCAVFNCVDCREFTKTDCLNSFVKHVRKHRKDLRNRCHYCDESINGSKLTAHVDQHYSATSRPCDHCGEIFPSVETLESHFKEFWSVKQIRKPRRKAGDPITIEDLTCHICKKIYKNPNSLRDHIKRHSDRKRNYTCDRCGKTFYSKGALTSHVMSHDDVRPHVCRICNKSFMFPNMLRRHVEMHSGVKPYSCEVCGRCFRLQYQLNAHKIVHTDSMPHVCSYCNKAFRFKQILKNHERQHTGAKPYSCQHCFMEFSNWSNYNKHMKRRHNIDTSKKKITPTGVFPVNPETGQIIQVDTHGMEEWKSKVMVPAKRGKKKAIKEENIIAVTLPFPE